MDQNKGRGSIIYRVLSWCMAFATITYNQPAPSKRSRSWTWMSVAYGDQPRGVPRRKKKSARERIFSLSYYHLAIKLDAPNFSAPWPRRRTKPNCLSSTTDCQMGGPLISLSLVYESLYAVRFFEISSAPERDNLRANVYILFIALELWFCLLIQ